MIKAENISRDLLFVGLTRPPMIFGLPYGAFVAEIMLAGLINVISGNPLYMLAIAPLHVLLYLIGSHDPGIFAEIAAWSRTMARCRNILFWGCASFSPLSGKKWQPAN